MGARIETGKEFVDYFIGLSVDSHSFLAKRDQLVDWRPFEKYLAKELKRGPATAEQPTYPDLVMFKASSVHDIAVWSKWKWSSICTPWFTI